MTESELFDQAIEAIRKDRMEEARELLTRLLSSDNENPDIWLWLSSVVESRKEKIYCLQTTLKYDASNQAALRGLNILGVGDSDREVIPIPVIPRNWKAEIANIESLGKTKYLSSPLWRTLLIMGASIGIIILLISGIFGRGRTIFSPRLTITPLIWTTTSTPTVTNTPLVRTPTPTPSVPDPLWMLLDATYTPRPFYVNTPHPGIEAYRIGLRKYENGEYESMLTYMEQVARLNPNLVDVQYYLGVAHSLLGEYSQAFASFERAIEINPGFAPVYVARAQAKLNDDENAKVEGDFAHAIELDPEFETAYLVFADYWIQRKEPQLALDVLKDQEELLGESPKFYLLQARALLELEQFERALDQILKSHRRDITNLPVYLLLAEIYFEIGEFETGLEYLNTYGIYEEKDPVYLTLLGMTYYELDYDYQYVVAVLDQTLNIDGDQAKAYEYRGLASLDRGYTQQAVDDLYDAKILDPTSF